MKNYRNIMSGLLLTAAAATAGLGMTACQSDKEEIVPQRQVWTVSMDANMGNETRYLNFSDTEVTPTFKIDERVAVFNMTTKKMMSNGNDGFYLAPQSDGASVKLSGTLTGSVSVGDKLKLIYFSEPGWYSFKTYDPTDVDLYYGNQVGRNLYQYDYALADVTVSSVSGTAFEVSGPATFQNMQSFFKAKFVFCDNAGIPIEGFTTTYYSSSNEYAMTITSTENSLVTDYYIWDGTSDPVEPNIVMGPVEWNKWRKGADFSYDTYFALQFRGSTSADKLIFTVVVNGVGTFKSNEMPAPTGGFQNGAYYCPSNPVKLMQQP